MKGRLIAASLILISAAFQFQGSMTLRAGDPVISALTFRDFFPSENGLRWSGATSTIVFPDPGPNRPVRVEVLLSGWRPPGVPAPRVVLSAGGQSVSATPGPGALVMSLDTRTSGWWRSDLVVEIRTDTFEPGPSDPRRLGIRVEEARLVQTSGGPRFPSLEALAFTAFGAVLVGFILLRAGSSPRTSERLAFGFVALAAVSWAFGRPWAALFSGTLLALLVAIAISTRLLPRIFHGVVSVVRASGQALAAGLSRLRDAQVAALVILGVLSVSLAYRTQSRIDIDLGSGREVAVAHGFGAFEGKGDLKSRRSPRGARLDLSDFGGGAWKIEASAALDGAPREVVVLKAAQRELTLPLREHEWTEGAMSAPAPFGWRSGLVLTVPGGSDLLRLDRVTIERGAALPSLRVIAAVVLTGLLSIVAFGAIGLSALAGRLACAFLLVGSTAALISDPLAAIPFALPFLGIVSAALALALVCRGLLDVFDPQASLVPGPVPIAAAVSGFVAWLAATAFPYYRGGHFIFHSSIAEEIWKGRFLIYYLPYPGSMLSEQAQWGKIVMPHPALYQTLVAPLAALPRPWFYLSEKVLLATFFASLVIVAAIVAQRVAGPRAAAFTAVFFAGLVPGFQLLGLGHLMTILGVWASSLALPWLIFKVDDLSRFRVWLGTAWLFTFCFLSYTASLLFTGAVLVWLILVSARASRVRAKAVFTMLLAACTFAFLLYYVHWTLPFLMQSVPKILGGAGLGSAATEATPILARLALEPGKLSYSYGSMLIPLLGALGLWLLPRSWDRLVLLTWIGILFFVSAADIFFNFLLKHHYFVMLPVAVGLGVVMTRIETRWGRIPAFILTVLALALGLQTAIDVALGRIP